MERITGKERNNRKFSHAVNIKYPKMILVILSKNFITAVLLNIMIKYLFPGDLIKNLKKNYLRRELWVPLEKIGDKIHVIIDDPNNIIKKDTIENLLKTKQIKYDVALEGRYN